MPIEHDIWSNKKEFDRHLHVNIKLFPMCMKHKLDENILENEHIEFAMKKKV